MREEFLDTLVGHTINRERLKRRLFTTARPVLFTLLLTCIVGNLMIWWGAVQIRNVVALFQHPVPYNPIVTAALYVGNHQWLIIGTTVYTAGIATFAVLAYIGKIASVWAEQSQNRGFIQFVVQHEKYIAMIVMSVVLASLIGLLYYAIWWLIIYTR